MTCDNYLDIMLVCDKNRIRTAHRNREKEGLILSSGCFALERSVHIP